MDSLRIALLVIGAAIVALVYWNARRKPSADIHNSAPGRRIEPAFDADADADAEPEAEQLEFSTIDDVRATRTARTSATGDSAGGSDAKVLNDPEDDAENDADENAIRSTGKAEQKVPEKVISLRIVKKDGGDFSAEEVVLTLRGVGLVHGRFGIFHRHHDEEDKEAVFSVASLTEPGSFDLQNIKEKRLAGLSFFMLRPGPGRGVEAYDKMVETGRAVATSLQGELLDGEGSTMSVQRERFMREELIQYELKHLKL